MEGNGLVQGDKIINTLVKLIGDQKSEYLPISFIAVAADIENEKNMRLKQWQNA